MKMYDFICSFFADPGKVIRLAFFLGLVFTAISTVLITGYANDAGLYIALIHAFAIGDWNRAFMDSIPPLFPAAAGIICKFGVAPWDAAVIVSGVLCILTIFPLYGTLCFFVDKKYAAWGALFYILAPKVMRWGFAPLTEGGRFFFLMLSVYFLFSFCRDKKTGRLVYLGISLALLALARGEGILFAPVIIFALIWLCLKKNQYTVTADFVRKTALYCLVILVSFLVVLSPRLYQVYRKTGLPATDVRVVNVLKKQYGKLYDSSRQADEIAICSFSNSPVAVPIKMPDERRRFSVNYLLDFLKNIVRGSYEVYLVLAVPGMLLLIRGRRWTLEYGILIFLAAANGAIYYFFSTPYRYFIVNIMLLLPFTMSGYNAVLVWAEKLRVIKPLAAGVFVLSLIQMVNGLDNSIDQSKIYWRKTGDLLKQSRVGTVAGDGNKTVYILGADCGTNLYNDFNIVNPGRSFIVLSIQNALKGFPESLCLSVARKTFDDKILTPDFIIVDGCHPDEISVLRNYPGVREIPMEWNSKIVLFENLKQQPVKQ